jgi:hypothetical protein
MPRREKNPRLRRRADGLLTASARLLGIALAALLAAGCGGGGEDEEAVRATFDGYRQALLDGDGERAAGLVTAGTVEYFEETRRLALEAPEAELRDRSLVDQLQVLTMRQQVPARVLRSTDGQELFAYSVQEGLVATEELRDLGIGEVTVDGDRATAEALSGGEKVALLRWQFAREDGRWKIDVTSLFSFVKTALERSAEDAGMSTEELILRSLEIASGKPVPPDIWEPLGDG